MAELDLARVQSLTCSQDNRLFDAALAPSGGLSRELDLSGLRAQIEVDLSGLRFEEQPVGGAIAAVRVVGALSGQTVDQDVHLVDEGGAWKVCVSGLDGP